MDFKKIKEKIKNFVEYLRGLDEKQKKTILWSIIGVLGVIMAFFWIKSVMYKLENIEAINFNLPQIETPAIIGNNTQIENQTSLTADWQTYTNDKYGFEFKYPNNWFVKEDKLNSELWIESYNYPKGFGEFGYDFDSFVDPTGGVLKISISTDTKKIFADTEVPIVPILQDPDTGDAVKFETFPSDFYHDNIYYLIERSFYIAKEDKNNQEELRNNFEKEFEQILSTFKFIP